MCQVCEIIRAFRKILQPEQVPVSALTHGNYVLTFKDRPSEPNGNWSQDKRLESTLIMSVSI